MLPRVSNNPIFAYGPFLGFYANGEHVRFIFWRKESGHHDWQGGRDVVVTRIYGGSRSQYMDIGADPLVLKTGAWFQSRTEFRAFRRAAIHDGQLWMNAEYTNYVDESRDPEHRVVHRLNMHYAIFDNVTINGITEVTFDNDGGVRCTVQFEREDFAWS